jgi:hypothetical protein
MPNANLTGATPLELLKTYAAELTSDADRLRKYVQFLQQEARDPGQQITSLSDNVITPQ